MRRRNGANGDMNWSRILHYFQNTTVWPSPSLYLKNSATAKSLKCFSSPLVRSKPTYLARNLCYGNNWITGWSDIELWSTNTTNNPHGMVVALHSQRATRRQLFQP